MKARPATPHDLDAVFAMATRFFGETGYSKFTAIDSPALLGSLRELIEAGQILVAGDQSVVGMIGLIDYPMYFAPQYRTAQELFWWVNPEARSTGAGLALLRAAEHWAKERGCQTITMLCLDAVEPQKVATIYERMGYAPLERAFIKKVM